MNVKQIKPRTTMEMLEKSSDEVKSDYLITVWRHIKKKENSTWKIYLWLLNSKLDYIYDYQNTIDEQLPDVSESEQKNIHRTDIAQEFKNKSLHEQRNIVRCLLTKRILYTIKMSYKRLTRFLDVMGSDCLEEIIISH